MAQNCRKQESGPDEVGRIVSEILDFVLKNRESFDMSLAEAGAQMTLSRLSKICEACGEANLEAIPTVDLIPLNEEPIERPKGQEQRKMHLLRLMSCKLSHAFDKRFNPNPLDRQVSVGLDFFMRRLLTMPVYDQLNAQCERVLLVSGRGDDIVLRSVMGNFMHRQFFLNILVRFAMAFVQYDVAKHMLMKELNESRPHGSPELEDEAFHLIMGALLNDVLLLARSQNDGALLDHQFGPKTVRGLEGVAQNLAKDRRGKR